MEPGSSRDKAAVLGDESWQVPPRDEQAERMAALRNILSPSGRRNESRAWFSGRVPMAEVTV